MTENYLKLTAYFGERVRSEHRFLADALLDLYGSSAVASSVMLRGVASYGPELQFRSDQSLSMSEDPPVALVAVDIADKITALAEQAVAMTPSGLITLERARLIGGSAPAATIPDTAKLTIYVGRRERVSGRPAHVAVCDALHGLGFAGAAVLLGVDGTAHGQRHRARFFSRNLDVPVMVIGVGTGDQVATAIPTLESLLRRPLLTVERAQLCKRDGQIAARPAALPSTDDLGRPLWQKLTIYTSEATLYDGLPIHRAIVRHLRRSRTAGGAFVLRGIWGFHGDHKPHGDKPIQLARQVPVITVVIDTPERIADSFEAVDQFTCAHGLVTSELVPAVVSIHGGHQRRGDTRLARHTY